MRERVLEREREFLRERERERERKFFSDVFKRLFLANPSRITSSAEKPASYPSPLTTGTFRMKWSLRLNCSFL